MNQSTAQSKATSSRGRLTACNTSNIVTRPADGIAAAPTAAAIAVTLRKKIMITLQRQREMPTRSLQHNVVNSLLNFSITYEVKNSKLDRQMPFFASTVI